MDAPCGIMGKEQMMLLICLIIEKKLLDMKLLIISLPAALNMSLIVVFSALQSESYSTAPVAKLIERVAIFYSQLK